jgi:hypothetical protein
LFEYGTGCEWHPSNQTLQCPVVTIRCYPWSAGSWQVFHNRRTRLRWCLARRGWNLRIWRKIHWSDESRFLLHVTDGRMRVWRWTFNDSPWLKSRRFQTVSNCPCWQTSIGQLVLFEYGTGCEWHPSKKNAAMPCRHDQMLPVVCRILASLSLANNRHAYSRDVLQSYWTLWATTIL